MYVILPYDRVFLSPQKLDQPIYLYLSILYLPSAPGLTQISISFNVLQPIIIIICLDDQIVSGLANESCFKMAPMSFWHNILGQFLISGTR